MVVVRQWLVAVCLLLLSQASATAYELTLKDTHGQVHHLSDYRGKYVLINFWATWCPPCLKEMPDLIALHEAHKNRDLVVIGVALQYASPKEVTDFAAKHGITYPVVLGDDNLVDQVGEVEGLPTSYLFDPAGRPVSYQPGMITRQEVEAFIRASKTAK